MNQRLRGIGTVLTCLLLSACAAKQLPHEPVDPYDSGGVLSKAQGAYDVQSYHLDIEVFPETKSIRGALTVEALVKEPMAELVLNLDPVLAIHGAEELGEEDVFPLVVQRDLGEVYVQLGRVAERGETVSVRVDYGGIPREAPNPPWSGGLTWKKTADGQPWIATTCQGEGADLWWPVKDHVSDKAERMTIVVTVPEPLIVASNGKLAEVTKRDPETRTYRWEVSTPISAYNVALNIAPYVKISGELESVDGSTFPVAFWVLPEDEEAGRKFFPEILDHLRFYEEVVGPYPFRQDKYGVAQTPHLGMEHQTITGYGARFNRGAMTGGVDWGFDALHHHELSHEWWGNLVTNRDWNDMWIHEGFGTYMQPLYLERRQGVEKAREYMASIRGRVRNKQAMAPRRSLSSAQVYGGDIYFKGAWVLHSLRYLIGDELFFRSLRRMAYTSEEAERDASGASCRFVTSDDFIELVQQITGRDLGWFFEVYLRHAPLPQLLVEREGDQVRIRWKVGEGLSFPMPVSVSVAGELRRVEVPEGGAMLTVPQDAEIEIDPEDWLLRAREKRAGA